jgi:hypothetical protein
MQSSHLQFNGFAGESPKAGFIMYKSTGSTYATPEEEEEQLDCLLDSVPAEDVTLLTKYRNKAYALPLRAGFSHNRTFAKDTSGFYSLIFSNCQENFNPSMKVTCPSCSFFKYHQQPRRAASQPCRCCFLPIQSGATCPFLNVLYSEMQTSPRLCDAL